MRKISNQEFTEKYYMYKPLIYSICYTYVHSTVDADDITQEVFMKYLKSDQEFETLDNEKYWLIRVAINTAKSFLKKAWIKKVILDEEVVNKTSETRNEQSEMFEIIYTLPQKYKEVIVLYYYENLSVKEISEVLTISVSNVKKRLERARNLIKERMAKE